MTQAARSRLPIPLLVVAVLVAGCGGSGAGPTDAPTGAASQTATSVAPTQASLSPTPTPQPTATAPRRQVGVIEQVLSTNANVDGADAFEQEPLLQQSELSTDPAGSVSFSIAGVIRRCTVIGSSEAEVQPSADVVLSFTAGSATCATEKSSSLIQVDAAHDAQLSMTDPLFVITVTPDATTVQVVQGLVAVRGGSASGGPAYLGPALQAAVADASGPGAPQPFDRNQLPPALLTPVEEQLGTTVLPGLTRPDPSGSPRLTSIFEQGRLLIGIDDRVAADPASAAFISEFRTFQSRHWDLGMDSVTMSAQEAVAALQEGKIGLFVTPAADAGANLPGAPAIPLFATVDPAAVVDLVTPAEDPVYATAERALVQALVASDGATDNYAALYRKAFDREPDYGPIAGLFGLGG